MKILYKVGGLVALSITVMKILAGVGVDHEILNYVVANSNFFYTLAVGIFVMGRTRNPVFLVGIMVFVYWLLSISGF